ncbi:MAG: hypothetical protein UHJ41_06040, partial [Bacteroidaceae bacterium]|nr:hypothetical protein [Bacteroidaceae bacterium]
PRFLCPKGMAKVLNRRALSGRRLWLVGREGVACWRSSSFSSSILAERKNLYTISSRNGSLVL